MAINVRVPTALRTLTDNKEIVTAEGSTVAQIIEDLQRQFPSIKERICDDKGELRRFVNVYLNNEDIRFMEGSATTVSEGDELSIVPAIAGGV
jgi:molybdopterin synthase sulfur carrier subunit